MRKGHLQIMNKMFEEEIAKEKLLGASIAVYHKGQQYFRNVYGSDARDSIYKIYSMTKPITAVALLSLYEKGLLDLSDPIEMYIPAYANMKVYDNGVLRDAKRSITIKDCMNMTSGLVYPTEENEPAYEMAKIQKDLRKRADSGEEMSSLKILSELAKAPLIFDPGSEWHYGLSADIIGGVIEVVSGMTLGEFLKKNIFEPLGMVDTDFYVPEEKIDRLAKMYSYRDEEGHLRESNEEELEWLSESTPTKKPYIESAGGGLYSTLSDYIRFSLMLLNGGEFNGVRILGRKTVDFLKTNQLTDEQLNSIYFDQIEGYGYGNLNRVMLDLAKANSNGSVGEYGWDGLPGCYFFVDPKEGLVVVYMQQIHQGADQRLRRKIRQIIYGALS